MEVSAVQIKPSAAIRQGYNDVSALCRQTKEPVYLTKNGEGDLVVMDIDSFQRREKMLELREALVRAEEERLAGQQGHTVSELSEYLDNVIKDAQTHGAV